ncbi:polygalacturonase-like [Musa acuminata AAA Group]
MHLRECSLVNLGLCLLRPSSFSHQHKHLHTNPINISSPFIKLSNTSTECIGFSRGCGAFMAQLRSFIVLLLVVVFDDLVSYGEAAYNIADYGAKSDGRTDSTKSLLAAWEAACGSAGSATMYVPAGDFLVGQATFAGPCSSSKITVQIDGTLVSPSDLGGAGDWLVFHHVEGVSVYGGTVDGRGSSLWACKAAGRSCAAGASSLTFRNSKDITISGLTSTDSELYHIVIDGCDGVTVQNVKITAPGNSPNTDGIHVQGSSHVTITGASIKTGDDCISVGPGTTNLWIEQVACGPGHGISIGSLGKEYDEEGVENVTVNTAVFTGTENGLRIKTWGRPSQGFVKGVVFEHAVMQNVQNPIIIDQNYCPGDRGCPDQSSGVRISGVTYNDIHGSSASEVAVNFDCSASNPCTGIGLQDIKLTYGNTAAESSCKHADGTASGFVVPPSCL